MQSDLIFPKSLLHENHLFYKTQIMAAPSGYVDRSNTIEDAQSQPLLRIQSSNYYAQPDVSEYPDELKMLIVDLNHFVLLLVMSDSFSVPVT